MNTYEFNRPGKKTKYFSNIGGFYTSESGQPTKNKKSILSGITNSNSSLNGELLYKDGSSV